MEKEPTIKEPNLYETSLEKKALRQVPEVMADIPPNFESKKIFIPDRRALKSMEGKTLSEVGEYLTRTYGSQYIIQA